MLDISEKNALRLGKLLEKLSVCELLESAESEADRDFIIIMAQLLQCWSKARMAEWVMLPDQKAEFKQLIVNC
jgi:hypothetical protein